MQKVKNCYSVNAFIIMILSIMYFSWICLSSCMMKLWTSITFVTCLKSVQRFCKNASRLFWLWNAIFTLFSWFLICHSDTVINDAIVHCRMGYCSVLLMPMVWGAFQSQKFLSRDTAQHWNFDAVWNILTVGNLVNLEQFISCPEHSVKFIPVTF